MLIFVVGCVPAPDSGVSQEDFDALVASVASLSESVESLAGSISGVAAVVESVDEKVDALAGDVASLQFDVDDLGARVDDLEAAPPEPTPEPTPDPTPVPTPAPNDDFDFVTVTYTKAVLREICGASKGKPQFNKKGFPIMCIYSADGTVGGRVKYEQGDVIAVYPDGDLRFADEYGAQTYAGGALIKADGNDFYYMVAGPRGEGLFVPYWHVSQPEAMLAPSGELDYTI